MQTSLAACFAVSIRGENLEKVLPGSCDGEYGLFAGLSPLGGTLQMEVPYGSDRTAGTLDMSANPIINAGNVTSTGDLTGNKITVNGFTPGTPSVEVGNGTGIHRAGTTDHSLSLTAFGTERVRILETNGYVGVHTLAPTAPLDVAGEIRVGQSGTPINCTATTQQGSIRSNAGILEYCDGVGWKKMAPEKDCLGEGFLNVGEGTAKICYQVTIGIFPTNASTYCGGLSANQPSRQCSVSELKAIKQKGGSLPTSVLSGDLAYTSVFLYITTDNTGNPTGTISTTATSAENVACCY